MGYCRWYTWRHVRVEAFLKDFYLRVWIFMWPLPLMPRRAAGELIVLACTHHHLQNTRPVWVISIVLHGWKTRKFTKFKSFDPSNLVHIRVFFINQWDFLSAFDPLWFPIGCLHTMSISSFHLGCMHRGSSVWIWTKRNPFWFIEGQTHPSTSWHAKISLTLNEPIKNVPCSNLHTTSECPLKSYRIWKVAYAKQPISDQMSRDVTG